MNFVTIAGRKFELDHITYAFVYENQTLVYSANYHQTVLTQDDAQRMNEALKTAGFVGEGTLINPRRVSAIEDAGTVCKIYLEGADRVVSVAHETIDAMLRTPELPALEDVSPEKARKSSSDRRPKKGAQ